MATQTKKASIGTGRDPYAGLMRKFRLRPLRTDEDLDRAIEMIDSLIVRGDLERGEQDYLDILTGIVEKYETAEHPMPPVSDAAMLRHLIEARSETIKTGGRRQDSNVDDLRGSERQATTDS